eukprot:3607672-Alexandrium_andersonii.AAC.1
MGFCLAWLCPALQSLGAGASSLRSAASSPRARLGGRLVASRRPRRTSPLGRDHFGCRWRCPRRRPPSFRHAQARSRPHAARAAVTHAA